MRIEEIIGERNFRILEDNGLLNLYIRNMFHYFKVNKIEQLVGKDLEGRSFSSLINSSFLWKGTPEEHDFWENIANKY